MTGWQRVRGLLYGSTRNSHMKFYWLNPKNEGKWLVRRLK
jgi:hypothetical protein